MADQLGRISCFIYDPMLGRRSARNMFIPAPLRLHLIDFAESNLRPLGDVPRGVGFLQTPAAVKGESYNRAVNRKYLMVDL